MLAHKKKQKPNPFFKLAFLGFSCVQLLKKKKERKKKRKKMKKMSLQKQLHWYIAQIEIIQNGNQGRLSSTAN